MIVTNWFYNIDCVIIEALSITQRYLVSKLIMKVTHVLQFLTWALIMFPGEGPYLLNCIDDTYKYIDLCLVKGDL